MTTVRRAVVTDVAKPSLIIYDGECIYCQNYVRFVRLRETIGPVELLDARSGDPRVEQFWREGFDLNEGMLFVHHGQTYHGADAIHVLAGLSSDSNVLNRLNAKLFSNRTLAGALYPLLKLGRRLTLAVRGRKLLAAPPAE
jgi:predicted DCC family thiol-disulfide oxidoreductase YuxK